MNLYEQLGVRRNASRETIRAAFRRCAMTAHPDKGGDAADFERLRLAHDILTDSARRAKYDAPGDIGEAAPDNTHVAVLAFLSPALDAALHAITANGGVAAIPPTPPPPALPKPTSPP